MIPKKFYSITATLTLTVGCFLFFPPESYCERQNLFPRETSIYAEENYDIALQEEEPLLEKTKRSVPAVSDIEKQELNLPAIPIINSLDGAKESMPTGVDADQQEKNLSIEPDKSPSIGNKISIPAVSDIEKHENYLPTTSVNDPVEATMENVKGTQDEKSESNSLPLPVDEYSKSKQAQEKREAR